MTLYEQTTKAELIISKVYKKFKVNQTHYLPARSHKIKACLKRLCKKHGVSYSYIILIIKIP